MKQNVRLSNKTERSIDDLVNFYSENRHLFKSIVEGLSSDILKDPILSLLVHSVKYRTKDPQSLSKKLRKKAMECQKKGIIFKITAKNLFLKITDLAGIRILHLYPQQMNEIKPRLEELLLELNYKTTERIAYTWDQEYKALFKSLGYAAKYKPSMYTSLHHVVVANRKSKIRCEIQIRTLMEEAWGEVDHTINYPDPSGSLACREQLKALARMASAGTRLVDSVFASHIEHTKSSSSPRPRKRSNNLK